MFASLTALTFPGGWQLQLSAVITEVLHMTPSIGASRAAICKFREPYSHQIHLALCVESFISFNACAIAIRGLIMMFVRVSVCLSVCAGVHYDYTVHVSADLSLCLDSPMFWTP